MAIFSASKLRDWTGGSWNRRDFTGSVTGFCQDTRRLRSGDMFVALRTDKRNGHDFLDAAKKEGASAALVEEWVESNDLPQLKVNDCGKTFLKIGHEHRNCFKGKVIGVTGTCGKTSTKDALRVLLDPEVCHGTKGNFNNLIGVPLTLLEIEADLHRYAVIEAGINQVGEMTQLASAIAPDVAIVTMVGAGHLEGLGNIETVAEEKAQIFQESGRKVVTVFPESCLEHQAFSQYEGRRIVLKRNNLNRDPDEGVIFFDASTETNTTGYAASLRLRRRGCPVASFPIPVLSTGMTINLALALATALEIGISENDARERLKLQRLPEMRGQQFEHKGRFFYVDCYNANPSSMADSLSFFHRVSSPRPRLYVIGGMEELGRESDRLHRELGQSLPLRTGDRVVLIGESARPVGDGVEGVDQVEFFDQAEDARDRVDSFDGAIFLKGSREHGLEILAPGMDKEKSNG
jgi:UDP-N-acetylmuramoyl-tripeptide--D-alanyl-D-alanine ligase